MSNGFGQKRSRGSELALRNALDDMEPNLRLLTGVASLLRSLSEAQDGIEPVALAAIAHLAGDAVERASTRWREACDVLHAR